MAIERSIIGSSIHQQRGEVAEQRAAEFLLAHGLTLVARNYRCRGGEIDLIARDGETLVFVEVRARRNNHYGGAAASITLSKQQRIIYAARHYLMQQRCEPLCRFDAILIDGDKLEWLRSAFDAF